MVITELDRMSYLSMYQTNSSPLMLEGVIKNIVTNGSGKKLEYLEVEAIKSKLMHFIVAMRYTLQLREARSLTGALRS